MKCCVSNFEKLHTTFGNTVHNFKSSYFKKIREVKFQRRTNRHTPDQNVMNDVNVQRELSKDFNVNFHRLNFVHYHHKGSSVRKESESVEHSFTVVSQLRH